MHPWQLVQTTRSAAATQRLGAAIGRVLRPGDVVLLEGTLGAGKTCLAQGLARGLGVPQDVRVASPTFSLINEHAGRLPLFHMDLYRLVDPHELDELGFDEYLARGGVAVIEWADRFAARMPRDALRIRLTSDSATTRRLELATPDVALQALLHAALTTPKKIRP